MTALPVQYFGSTLRAWIDKPSIFFDGDKGRFNLVAAGLVLCTIMLALCGSPRFKKWIETKKLVRWIVSPWTFAVAVAITFAFCRWPAITNYYYMGQDENVMLAGANTLRHDPIFWRTVQSTTSGPLNYYPLLIPAIFGLPLDNSAARIMCLLVEMIDLLTCYRIFRFFLDDLFSRLAILPIWGFWATAAEVDFVQYTSETIPILILTLATYLAVRWLMSPTRKIGLLLLLGFVLGLLPFAKLQSIPGGAAIALSVLIRLMLGPRKMRNVTAFILAGFFPAMLVLAFTALFHVAATFWFTYVQYNLGFAASNSQRFLASLRLTGGGLFSVPQFGELTISLCVMVALGSLIALCCNWQKLIETARPQWRANFAIFVLLCAVPLALFWAIMARGAAGTYWWFYHYYLFLLIPQTLLSVLWVNWLALHLSGRARFFVRVLLFVPIACMARHVADTSNYLRPSSYYASDNRQAVAGIISELTQPGDALVIWGWHPELYVHTQLRQGISFATVERELGANGSRDPQRYRDQFMRDIRRSQPRVIVDTTGPWDSTFTDQKKFGHEVFPEFTQFLTANYKYFGRTVEGFRIYLRKSSAGG